MFHSLTDKSGYCLAGGDGSLLGGGGGVGGGWGGGRGGQGGNVYITRSRVDSRRPKEDTVAVGTLRYLKLSMVFPAFCI